MDGGELEAPPQQGVHFLGVVGQAATGAAQGEARSQHDWIAHFGCEIKAILDIGDQPRARHFEPDLGHRRLERLAILGLANRLEVGADQLDPEFVQDASLG